MFTKVLLPTRVGQFIHSGRYSATWHCQSGRELDGLQLDDNDVYLRLPASSIVANEQCLIAIGSHGRMTTLVLQRVNWCILYLLPVVHPQLSRSMPSCVCPHPERSYCGPYP